MNFFANIFGMSRKQSTKKINFEDVQYAIKNKQNFIIINTMNQDEQNCLIKETTIISNEVTIINEYMNNQNLSINIVIYGKNASCDKIYEKYDYG